MKKVYGLCLLCFTLSIGSIFIEEDKPVERKISSVEDCVSESTWGEPPAKVTKESVCRCHPELCAQPEDQDTQTGKGDEPEVTESSLTE